MSKPRVKVEKFLESKVCKTERDYFKSLFLLKDFYGEDFDFNLKVEKPRQGERVLTYEQLHIFITT